MKNLSAKRAAALATIEQLRNPRMWTFRPLFDQQGNITGGFYIARRLIRLPNAQLQQVMAEDGWRLASLTELMLTQIPFTPERYLLENTFPMPWGKEEYFHANRLFIEEGIGVGDILYGGSPLGCWAVVEHAGTGVRAGGAHNIGIFDDLIDDEGRLVNAATGEVGEYAELNLARDAGYLAGLELEANEAYLLAKPVPAQELELHKLLIYAQGEKLSADSGIGSRSQPSQEGHRLVVWFASGGGCSRCAFLEHTTAATYAADVLGFITPKMLHTIGYEADCVEIRLQPEYEGWAQKGYSDTPFKLASRK